jgi:hypothetical protein
MKVDVAGCCEVDTPRPTDHNEGRRARSFESLRYGKGPDLLICIQVEVALSYRHIAVQRHVLLLTAQYYA